MKSLQTAGQFLLQGDIQICLNSQSGATGGPKPNSSWPSWERSSDLETCGGSPTSATKTAGVSGWNYCSPRQENRKTEIISFFCRCVLHPIHFVHVYVRSSLVLPWDFGGTVYKPGRNHMLEKDMPAFPRFYYHFKKRNNVMSLIFRLQMFSWNGSS